MIIYYIPKTIYYGDFIFKQTYFKYLILPKYNVTLKFLLTIYLPKKLLFENIYDIPLNIIQYLQYYGYSHGDIKNFLYVIGTLEFMFKDANTRLITARSYIESLLYNLLK